jgi:putative oxygen-independent coproporphyrinogen III oxidase
MTAQTLGLYIQVPFCASKCTFCNFSSRVEPASLFDRYCASLELELQLLPDLLVGSGIGKEFLSLEVDSIYFGGGTPSLLGGRRLRRLMASLRRNFRLAPSVEFTLEITPGSADARLLEEMREFGVNRLSIGAQSFNDLELRSVGRLHSAQDTAEQVHRARRAGIGRISLDLIAGLPNQTEESWRKNLDLALALAPHHVSVYLFEVDEKSRLGKEVLEGGARYHAGAVPNEEFMAAAYEQARLRLGARGYQQYEISNFALSGCESKHNLKYWQVAPYLGLGAGAHSFDGAHRWSDLESVEAYEERLLDGELPISEIRQLSSGEQIEEFFFLGLRRRDGVDLGLARQRWGQRNMDAWQGKIEELVREGWLELAGEQVRLASRALLVSNEIFQEFVAA